MRGKGTTQPSCRAHVTHDPRVGALQHLHVADTPSFPQRGLNSGPPVPSSQLCGTSGLGPLYGFSRAAALPPPGSPAPAPFFPSWSVASGRPPVRPRVEPLAIMVGWGWGGRSSTACPSLLRSAAGNRLWRSLKWSLTHWAFVEFPCPCLSVPICKMGGILTPTSEG